MVDTPFPVWHWGHASSTVLFDIVFNILIDIVSSSGVVGYQTSDKSLSASTPTYADDVTLIASTPRDNQRQIDFLEDGLRWSKTMCAKPRKCRSFAMKRFQEGQETAFKPAWGNKSFNAFDPMLSVQGNRIKFIGDQAPDEDPFKFLGGFQEPNLKEQWTRDFIETKLAKLLLLVDSQPLAGVLKLWLYQFGIVLQLGWMLLIHTLLLTFAKKLEKQALPFLKKLSGIPSLGQNTAILFLPREDFGVGLTPLATLYKQMQTIKADLCRTSSDPSVRAAYEMRLQREGRASSARYQPVVELEVGIQSAEGWKENPRSTKGRGSDAAHPTSQRKTVLQWIKHQDLGLIREHAKSLCMQGQFTKWRGLTSKMIGWGRLMQTSRARFKFMVNAMNQSLNSRDNLKRWRRVLSAVCPLCGRGSATVAHVLSFCGFALRQGRFTWRHNACLRVLFPYVCKQVALRSSDSRDIAIRQPFIQFCRAGQTVSLGARRPLVGIVPFSDDWIVEADLPSQPYSLATLTDTSLRPDILVFSRKLKKVIMFELTVPREENIVAAERRKKARYRNLCADLSRQGWDALCYTGEVGCLGLVAHSVRKFLLDLGLARHDTKVCIHALEDVARFSSHMIFMHIERKDWSDYPIPVPCSL